MVGRSRQGEERVSAIVAAAFGLIAAKGLEGLRLRHVAGEVGIDHSTLHHYFPTKEDLVAAVVDHATRQFWSTTPPTGTPAERLRVHLTTLGRMIPERPELFTVLREVDLRANRDPAVRAIVRRHEEGWRAALTPILAQGGWIDPATGTELIIAAVKGASLAPSAAPDVLNQLATLIEGV